MYMRRSYYNYEPRQLDNEGDRKILREPLRTRPVEEEKKKDPRQPDWVKNYGINLDNYVSMEEGADLYSMSTVSFMHLAYEAGAVKSTGHRKWVNMQKFEQFLEDYRL